MHKTQRRHSKNKNLIRLFEVVVAKNKNSIAVIYDDHQFTYDEINKRANQLAHFIGKFNISPNACVALYLERNIETIIAFLAIMKAGYSYLPIDIEAPPQMIKNILDDANTSLILTETRFSANIQALSSEHLTIVALDHLGETLKQEKTTNLNNDRLTHVAYVLYTSGSTGLPKGVQVAHHSIINLIYAMADELDFTGLDRLLAITPLTFDLSVPDIYLPLLTGGSLVLAPPTIRFNPSHMMEHISTYKVTLMQATPVTWQMLLNAGWKNLSRIKMITGGEGLVTRLAEKLIATKAPLWNFYGPTETTVWSTYHKVETIDTSRRLVSIGKPIANTQLYILNDKLEQQPIDTPGELYIGGDGVAVGYLNHPELTLQSFIPDPFTSKGRLYKTGDIVFQSKEGDLHYVGRADNQIKIRGYRIEAGAIEHLLITYENIKECVVLDKNPDNELELVAYVVLKKDRISVEAVKKHLKQHLPIYMIPSKFVAIEKIPLTPNGKINRKAIPHQRNNRILQDKIKKMVLAQNNYEEIIVNYIKVHLKSDNFSPESNFFDLGMHSIGLVGLAATLSEALNKTISAVDLFEHTTIRSLANYLGRVDNCPSHPTCCSSDVEKFLDPADKPRDVGVVGEEKKSQTPVATAESLLKESSPHDIAVIGMSCRLPGANSPLDFWKLILAKQASIQFFNESELLKAGISFNLINHNDYVPARGILTDIDKFDATFFGYSPYEARITDPQHRVFLEQSWGALEDAGYSAGTFSGKIGVFAGMNDTTYLHQNLLKNKEVFSDCDQQQLLLATSTHYLATKVAYAMDLTGPCVTVNNACSTGLTTIAMACESLTNSSSDMALAGAITIVTPQESGYLYKESGILSPDGRCAVFDEEAKGTVLSNGCGIVVLKKLSNALRDNDNILAIIKGWAVNNDGRDKAGFTAPSIKGQVNCIRQAISHAAIEPTEVEYVEAHGTGTVLGDPIEVKALTKGYQSEFDKKNQYCAIGSVKANIGHTDSAAGVAGFIKTVLALHEKTLPPNIHFSKANKKIHFQNTPYYVNSETKTWNTQHHKRTAAVNALGFGGTNAHFILQEAPEIKTSPPKKGNIFILSAKTVPSLTMLVDEFKQQILKFSDTAHTEKNLADMAYTLQVGRSHFSYRIAIPYVSYEDLLSSLSDTLPVAIPNAPPKPRQIIFGFVGQGAQYASMAKHLYKEQPLVKQTIDDCCDYLASDLQLDLRTLLFPEDNQCPLEEAHQKLKETEYAQPALFIVEYAISKLLMSLGIHPTAMIGHSVGEYVAATLAGVFSLENALKIISIRAKLMGKTTSAGAMLAVPLSKERLLPLLTDKVELAVHSTPTLCMVSGLKEELLQFEKVIQPLLNEEHLSCQYLQTSGAFHSKHMDEILDEFLSYSANIEIGELTIPYVSNVTGKWITADDLKNRHYWASHIRQPVLFSEGIEQLALSAHDIFIEIGPGQILSQLIRQHHRHPNALSTLPHYKHLKDNDYRCFLSAISKLWLLNIPINWSKLYTHEIRRKISLPTYAFERHRYWIKADQTTQLQNTKIAIKDALYSPIWERDKKLSTLVANDREESLCWLIFGCEKYNQTFKKVLRGQSQRVCTVTDGREFKQAGKDSYSIDLSNREHYISLLKSLNTSFKHLKVIHHYMAEVEKDAFNVKQVLEKGPYALLYLTQAFSEVFPLKHLQTLVITNQMYSVLGNERLAPLKTAVLGPCKVIPQEQNNITFKVIDIDQQAPFNASLINRIIIEAHSISMLDFKEEIAYRGDYCWVQRLKRCTDTLFPNKNRLIPKGIYIITGGLGGIGLALAHYLAKTYHAHLILISRTPFPSEDRWETLLNTQDQPPKLLNQIKQLIEIKKNAKSLHLEFVALENKAQLSEAFKRIKYQYKGLNGVIHAAGIPGGGVAQLKSVETFQKVLQPKLFGTQNLLDLLTNEPLDFFVFISSITAITGSPGQVDYCAANRILDAYSAAAFQYFKHPVFCVTMNWQAWRDVGMAATSETLLFRLDETNSTSPHDGCLLFEKILNANQPQVIISNLDLNDYTPDNVLTDTRLDYPNLPLSSDEQSNITAILHQLFCRTLGLTEVGLDMDFYELGGHSLLAISLLSKMRAAFNININAATLSQTRTIRGLSKIIQSHVQEESDNTSLVVLQQGDHSRPPLFLIHPVGGTVFCYLPLVKALPNDLTIIALQDPSIEKGRPLFLSVEEMATYYRTLIQQHQPHGPYYLGGASFGASVATEIAHQLLEAKEAVRFLGLIDGWGKFSETKFDIHYVQAIINHHISSNNNGSINHLENQTLWEALLQHRLEMMVQYRHKKLPIQLTLFKATELLSEYKKMDAVDNHWSPYSAFPIHVFSIMGDHNTLLQDPHVAMLAKCIVSVLV